MASRKKFLTKEMVQIILAIIAAITAIGVAYFQFVWKPSQSESNEPTVTQYSGRILDDASLKPIANAKITLDLPRLVSQIAYTDTEGVYIFSLALSQEQRSGRVRVDANGYETYDRNISLSTNVLVDIRLTPTLPLVEPTNTPEPTSTLPPSETPTPTLSNAIIVMNNFYSWINNSGNKDDLLRSWNLETSGINGFQCREQARCVFANFQNTWWPLKVQYKLYDCGSNLVDTELRYYKRDPILASTPTAPAYFRYQLVDVSGQLKINKGTNIEGPGADCKLEISVP